jgi:hypothetical protein
VGRVRVCGRLLLVIDGLIGLLMVAADMLVCVIDLFSVRDYG